MAVDYSIVVEYGDIGLIASVQENRARVWAVLVPVIVIDQISLLICSGVPNIEMVQLLLVI